MLVLTLHIVFPVIIELGLDPIWFGVVVVIVLEMGLDFSAGGGQRLCGQKCRKGCAYGHHI